MKRLSRNRVRPGRRRTGAVLIAVLACAAVAVSLVMLSVQVSLQQRRKLKIDHQLEQTRWVLDAAIRKSMADPAVKAGEDEVLPKLEKFDKVMFRIAKDETNGRVVVQAKIENSTETNVTARSASFKTAD